VRTRTVTVKQLLLAGCVLSLAVVGGVYAWLTRGGGRRDVLPAAAGTPAQLVFRETVWPHDPENPDAQAESEWRRPGHHDFPFRAEGNGPVRVWLQATGCACTKVELGIGTAQDGTAPWHVLRPEDAEGISVPAQVAGAVRVSWRGEVLGPKRLTAELRTRSGESEGERVTLEVPLRFVRPVRLAPEDSLEEPEDGEVRIGGLGAGETRTVRLIAWSSTREHFSLAPAAPTDPHVGWAAPEALDGAECERLARGHDTQVRCAYRISVTVRERTRHGEVLDLGPFSCQLRFASDADPEPVVITLAGMVSGPVMVGSDADGGMVALGSFQRSEGKTRELTLTAEEKTLELQVDSLPDFLKVQLRDEKAPRGRAWRLTVTVPPDSLIGSIPPHTAVLLRTTGSEPRRIRIPVTGYAYLK
jgi:hypothetical protein